MKIQRPAIYRLRNQKTETRDERRFDDRRVEARLRPVDLVGDATSRTVIAQRVDALARRMNRHHVRQQRDLDVEPRARDKWLEDAPIVAVAFQVDFLEVKR